MYKSQFVPVVFSSLLLLVLLLQLFFVNLDAAVVNAHNKVLTPKPSVFTRVRDWTFTYSGGAPFCSQCGAMGEYACSDKSNFNPLQQYTDLHSGVSVLRVEAVLTGSYGCTSAPATSAVVALRLNGIDLDILNLNGGQQCKCNTCDGNVTFAKDFPYGFPIYSFDSDVQNNATVTVYTGSICLNTLTLRVFYGTPAYPFSTAYTRVNWAADRRVNNGFCGWSSASYSSDRETFADPLPPNSLVYSVDVVVYGTYFSYLSSCINAQLSIQLNGFGIGGTASMGYPRSYNQSAVVTRPCSQTGCDGQWLVSLGQLYQNGVPNYVYGGNNVLSWTGNSYTNLAFADVYLYYYPQPRN